MLNKHMHIGQTGACDLLKKGMKNVPQKQHCSKGDTDYVGNKVFKKVDYNVSINTPDKEINILLT